MSTDETVLSILAAFWDQVEYRTKQMMPWAILHKGPFPAADTLLLDYIEPPRLISLFASIRNAHHPVSLAITGSLLLQFLTVVSTGLLILQDERMQHSGVVLLPTEDFRTEFHDYSAFNTSPVLSAIALNNGKSLDSAAR